MKVFILLLFAFEYSNAIPKMHTGSIMVTPGSAFMNYVIPAENEIITKCGLKFIDQANKTVEIDLKMNGTQIFGDGEIEQKLSNLGRNTCGFRFTNYTLTDSTTMNITAKYQSPEGVVMDYDQFFNLGIYEHVKLENTIKKVKLGYKAEVDCGQQNVQKSCNLYDPKGDLVVSNSKKIKYTIKRVTMEHIGVWRCLPTIILTMSPLEETQELQLYQAPKVEMWFENDGEYGMIGCNFTSEEVTAPIEFCQMLSPDLKQYSFTDSVGATERYTTLGTNMANFVCQIEFKLPILESEKGVWKCSIGGVTGGYIDTNDKVPNYKKRREIVVELKQEVDIMCDVPYSSDNCFIQSPLGDIIPGGSVSKFRLGECKHTIVRVETSHLGIWRCIYSKPSESADDVIEVELKALSNIQSVYVDIEVDEVQTAMLMCTTKSPIFSCQFIDPRERSYLVAPHKMQGNVQYMGRGFEYGECGARIVKTDKDMDGVWKCLVGILAPTDGNENALEILTATSKITVNTTVISQASAIGIPVGISTAVLILIGVALYRRFRKRNIEVIEEDPPRMSTTSSDSNTDIPIMTRVTTQNITYDATL